MELIALPQAPYLDHGGGRATGDARIGRRIEGEGKGEKREGRGVGWIGSGMNGYPPPE